MNAWKIFKLDRYKHASPNSAQTESVCAGALNIQMAGDAVYDGVIHKKKFIGDDKRPIEPKDIRGGEITGMGFLDIETVFSTEKTRTQTEGTFSEMTGFPAGINGIYYRGYEIHMGQSGTDRPVIQNGKVFGSYIHGLFDEKGIAETIVKALFNARGLSFNEEDSFDPHEYREAQYDKLADTVRNALDMDLIYSILNTDLS